ncbi:oligopeptide/dipeptide ABC transporter ATP-binding protein [Microvirga sp. 17 mud 1-3]|uniref:oligopeptide/dipeptide ABC transporter ATP-binding protein n=1 Tax=Microvirga sp. 17 mud 1-3 TaxID=2082949 RepID=UPI000D6CC701|nr:oligopeptide/dipeptide ABC transporter ATP-binding protein [Microvirga sp. 17 mud 1-3]AWM87252.1 ABC transporter ATP-binding protein [Microvirga sp. 17 mud 1-3]
MTVVSPLVSVQDLSVSFPSRGRHPAFMAVNGVSFDIAPGETLGLVGQSGSGKTTTGRAVLQLQKISSGSVKLRGRELTTMPQGELRRMRRHMQFVLQNPYSSLHPRMTIAQTLMEPLIVHEAVPKTRYRERVAELLELVSMDPSVMDRYPHAFSGGQRQRIVIARALAVNPDFVVCDEPVSALDVRTQAQIVALLHSLQEKLKLSYLFIAHDLAIVREVCHKVAVMYRGEIVEKGEVSQVYDNPSHPYTQILFDSAPVLDPALQRRRLQMTPPDPSVLVAGRPDETCALGEIHAGTGTAPWHEIAPGHGVSCRYRPA